ncbi:MAG: hypothetical protein NC081_12295, partial [Roseburia sp.]|nr:hypothetical protein [Roseburia sp.]
PSIRLEDGTEKIFLNTKGTRKDVDEELLNLLNYFESREPQDAYTRELEEAVTKAKEHKEWRMEYMKLHLWEMDVRAEGREEGREEGETRKLIELVCRKIRKGKPPEVIAQELEEAPEVIRRIYETAVSFAPEFDTGQIYKHLK